MPKNHQGLFKPMKCEAIYLIVKGSFNYQNFICSIIIDNDGSFMKSNLKHSWEEKVKQDKKTWDE